MVYLPERGTYEIDRIIETIGRVRLRTGTKDKRVAQRYENMLDALPLAVVKLIAARQLSLRVAYDAWTAGQLRGLPTGESILPLIVTMRAWVEKPKNPVSDKQTVQRAWVVAYFEAQAPQALIRDLAPLLSAMRLVYADRGASFNRTRATCQAFLRDFVGTLHRDYDAVSAIDRLPERPKFARHICTVQEARAIAAALAPPWNGIWWALCCTGMNPKEFWQDGWQVIGAGVEIHGRKRPARNRVVPLVVVPPAPQGRAAGFAEALERAGLGVTPVDARRSYARWLDEIGLPDYRQDAYTGHGPKAMRELYKWGDITAWLAEDGRKLRAHVGEMLRLEAAQ